MEENSSVRVSMIEGNIMEEDNTMKEGNTMEEDNSMKEYSTMEEDNSMKEYNNIEEVNSIKEVNTMEEDNSMKEDNSMEKGIESISLLGQLEKNFDLTGKDIRTYSPLALAYIGDGVYELMIRTIVVRRANRPANELHKSTISYVNAESQARLIEVLLDSLTEEEMSVYRRGRNAKVSSVARHSSIADYHKATGFEALIGYLYLTDQMDRVMELVKMGMDKL